jgi:hypothetical protein
MRSFPDTNTSNPMSAITPDAYGQLVDLLGQRRRMVKRHVLAKKKRQQYTLAEKLEIDRKHKAKVAELDGRIEGLKQQIGEAV